MNYSVIYSEQTFDNKPPKRYKLENLTHEKVMLVVEILKVPIQGKLIKWVVYDGYNNIVQMGESRCGGKDV